MWLWLACSAQDMKSTDDAFNASEMDSGFYSDTSENAVEEDAGDAAPEVVPAWKKLSVNITEDADRWSALLWDFHFKQMGKWVNEQALLRRLQRV